MVKGLIKTGLSLLLGFILTLQPLAYAFADETSTDVILTIEPGIAKTIKLELPVSTGDGAVVTIVGQGQVAVAPGGSIKLTISEDDDSLDLPFSLGAGQDIESFTDPDTGITITGEDVRIPLRNNHGEEILVIKAKKTSIQQGDIQSKVILQDVVLESSELAADMSSADATVGTIGASFKVGLDILPDDEDVLITAKVTKTAERQCRDSFDQAARAEQKYIANIAYVLAIDKTNLRNTIELEAATITMKVGIQWMQDFGFDNIVILRCGEEGYQELETDYIGNDDSGNAIFQAQSPVGLSFFGLVAYGKGTIINWLAIGSGVGGFIIVIAVTFFIILRRRRLRAERVSSTWSTGLDADDWKDVD